MPFILRLKQLRFTFNTHNLFSWIPQNDSKSIIIVSFLLSLIFVVSFFWGHLCFYRCYRNFIFLCTYWHWFSNNVFILYPSASGVQSVALLMMISAKRCFANKMKKKRLNRKKIWITNIDSSFICHLQNSCLATGIKQRVHFQLRWAEPIPDDIYHVELTIRLFSRKHWRTVPDWMSSVRI